MAPLRSTRAASSSAPAATWAHLAVRPGAPRCRPASAVPTSSKGEDEQDANHSKVGCEAQAGWVPGTVVAVGAGVGGGRRCGGWAGGSSSSSNNNNSSGSAGERGGSLPPSPTQLPIAANAANTVPITVCAGGGKPPHGYFRRLPSTVCPPGTTSNCQIINNVQVDTGSFGLRVVSSGR